MSRRMWNQVLCIALLGQLLDAKGSFGGSRGSSGARSSSSFSSSSSRGSSSYSGSSGSSSSFSGSRATSGTSSYRGGSTSYNSNFRQNVFHTTSTTTTFAYSPLTSSHVIISPVTPIYFGSYHYYWGGHYVSDYQRPMKCEYEISDEDQELRNVTFSNGTKPTTLTFGCKSSEECCGLECCSNSSSWIWIVLIVVGVVVIFMMCSWCSKNGYGYCQSDTVVTTAVPVITTTTTTHSYTVPSAPPPPPGFQQFGPPPQNSQPIYAPPPQYDQFQQNSPYDNRPLSSSHITFKQ